MPMQRHKYPPDWPAISERARARAGDCCEECGVANHAVGYRTPDGAFHPHPSYLAGTPGDGIQLYHADDTPWIQVKLIRIVLTVSHTDHDTHNNVATNLRALCQRCHLRHDRFLHGQHAAATRARKRPRLPHRDGWQLPLLPKED